MPHPTTLPPRPALLTPAHLERYAVIYLRRSSPFQVQHYTGSTARQYSLQELATAWGWPPERIVVVDDDLGSSGAKIGTRMGFPQMLALITTGKVSAVFTVHADRLARNLLEFAQLVTACEQFQVPLVIDGEIKDLREAGDRLLTVLLGVFAEHENRDRIHKLRGSLLAKIRVHQEALGPPPAGYEAPVDLTTPAQRRRRWGTRWHKSPDPAVVQALETVFSLFRVHGTVGAVVRQLRRLGLRLPCRVMCGPQYGTIVFQPVTHTRVRAILTSPSFTDAFVFQKTRQHAPVVSRDNGTVSSAFLRRPPAEWLIVRDHHEPYIAWEEFWANQERMHANRSLPTAIPRNGPALLGRLLKCGHCGYAMVAHYGRGARQIAHGQYQCRAGGGPEGPSCHTVSTSCVDPPVIRTVLQTLAALTPQAVAEALAQEQAAHTQQQRLHTQALQEADAAVVVAERRYKAVDPDNTLVRQQLEREYEAALQRRNERELAQARTPPPALPESSPNDAQALLQVAVDVRQVWEHPAVTNAERKEILRALRKRSKSGVIDGGDRGPSGAGFARSAVSTAAA